MKSLYIFDIDDTLITTNSFIHEMHEGERVKSYSTEEWKALPFGDYKGANAYDWSDCQSSHTFRETAQPIPWMIQYYKNLYYSMSKDSRIILMTGRQPMSCEDTYKKTFDDLLIPIRGVDIFWAGRYRQHSPMNKMIELLCYLQNHNDHPFDRIEMYDDDPKNFKEVLNMDYYKVEPYLVIGGKFEKYIPDAERSVLEKID